MPQDGKTFHSPRLKAKHFHSTNLFEFISQPSHMYSYGTLFACILPVKLHKNA